MQYNINNTPTITDLKYIKKWLIEEEQSVNEGFDSNWHMIESAFHDDELTILNLNDFAVGFIVSTKQKIHIEIDIMEIKPECRKNGIGKLFFNLFLEAVKNKEFVSIKLFCSPRESEGFWKKMGFIKFPEEMKYEPDLTYYKPLVEIQEISKNENTENKIELWDVDPHRRNKVIPRWTWNVEIIGDKLVLPVLQPCCADWNLRWTQNGKIIRDCKAKYFGSAENGIDYSPFLHIKQLF
jgi:N-acetylglutamate synthase-like GNAT family acetyltransferase